MFVQSMSELKYLGLLILCQVLLPVVGPVDT